MRCVWYSRPFRMAFAVGKPGLQPEVIDVPEQSSDAKHVDIGRWDHVVNCKRPFPTHQWHLELQMLGIILCSACRTPLSLVTIVAKKS